MMSSFNQRGDSSGLYFSGFQVFVTQFPFISNQREIGVVSLSFRDPDHIFD